jgi:hypothetical protein
MTIYLLIKLFEEKTTDYDIIIMDNKEQTEILPVSEEMEKCCLPYGVVKDSLRFNGHLRFDELESDTIIETIAWDVSCDESDESDDVIEEHISDEETDSEDDVAVSPPKTDTTVPIALGVFMGVVLLLQLMSFL